MKVQYKKIPMIVSLMLAIASSLLSFVARSPILLFLMIEVAAVSCFYLLFVTIVPFAFPTRVDPESVFTGGTAKPPYLSAEELYRPTSPLTLEEEARS